MAGIAFPESYKDPLYASLDASTEQKLGLPSGLLSSIRLNGEKSNHSQVSEAGASGVYQFIPSTRKAILDKYGLDVTLSPQNASEGAGLLLQEGLKRTGTPQGAVAEYHGGLDPANWGPKTRAYVQRVTQGLGAAPDAQGALDTGGVKLPPFDGWTSFEKAQAQMQAEQAPSQLKAIHDAYQGGQMSPGEATQYEADVRSGAMMLPRGATLKTEAMSGPGTGGAVAGTAQAVPDGVLAAYKSGQMTPQEMAAFEHDTRNGAWQLPNGQTPGQFFGPEKQPQSVADRLIDSVTGSQRRTQTTDALPDWAGMPELNSATFASLKAGLGTMLTNPQETAQVIAANFPGVQVRQDQKGNFILRSAADGQEYAIKPGFQWSDVPRAIGGALAFTPAGRAETIIGAGLKSAATQTAIEATQAATGGNFDTHDVVTAGAAGALLPAAARVLDFAAAPARTAINRVLGRTDPALSDTMAAIKPGGAGEAGAPTTAALPAAQPGGVIPPAAGAAAPVTVPAGASSVESVAQTARAAAGGSKQAIDQLAGAAAPDAQTVAAADRLGITNYLQPDHVTTNDAYRQVVGILKSNPTSQLAQSEKEGLAKVAERASNLIDEVGGTSDLSALDQSVKKRMQAAHSELSTREDALYQKLRDTIPATTEAPATSAMEFLQQRAKDLGGEKNLSPMEKAISARLAPKGGATEAELDALGPSAKAQAQAQGVVGTTQPTYALLDDVRRDVGAAARMRGPFSDADTGLAKKYYGLLSKDQAAVANAAGMTDVSAAARAATVARKGMEDDLSSLFGKKLDQSLVTDLGSGMKAASGGNTAPLLAILKATPDAMKQEVVASGLSTVFRNAATRGEINFTGYAKWYEGLQRNQQAYTAVMSNLPPAARQQLADLYRVSKGISDSLNARIKTGLRSSVLQELAQGPDTLAVRLFDLAKHAGKGLAVDAVGGHGAGIAMGLFSAIKGNAKPNAIKAIDELLASPEFQQLAATAGTPKQAETVRAFAYSKSFTKFARAVGNPRELSNREKWVLQALETRNSMD